MSLRMMTEKKENVEVVTDYPGCRVDQINHHYDCPHRHDGNFLKERGPNCTENCRYNEPIYLETTYAGCVLDTYERNGYDDSDFYAIVWDENTQKIEHICYSTTRGWSYPNGASVDATPEVIAKAVKYIRDKQFAKWQEDNVKQSEMPYKGRKVRVVAGRKVEQGVVGEVFWFGEDQYKASQRRRYNQYNPYADLVGKFLKHRYRIGLKWTENGEVKKEFLSAENVEVIDPQNYLENEEIAREQINKSQVYFRGI